jgi:hypothetical protein
LTRCHKKEHRAPTSDGNSGVHMRDVNKCRRILQEIKHYSPGTAYG